MSLGALGAFAESFAAGRQAQRDRKEREVAGARQDRALDIMEKQANAPLPAMGVPPSAMGGAAAVKGVAPSRPAGENADYIRAGLVKRGMAPHIVDGWMMNLQDESGLNAAARGDNGNAYGLAQWNGPRMRALQSFAGERGLDASDRDLQMDYLMHELQGPEAGAWKKIQAAQTPGAAAAAILNHFERPAEVHRARREQNYLSYDARPPALGAIRS